MRLLVAAGAAFAVQLLLGGVIFGVCALLVSWRRGAARRRRLLRWTEASYALLGAAPWAVGLFIFSFLVLWLASSRPVEQAIFWVAPWWFLLLGAVPSASCWLTLQAGLRESRGELRTARRLMRLGGQSMFLGILSQLILIFTLLLFHVPFRRAVLVESSPAAIALVVGLLSLGTAAFIGIVAGLAGKPRPSAWFAALAYVVGLVGLVGTAQFAPH